MSNISISVLDNNMERSAFSVGIASLNPISYAATKINVDDLVTTLAAVTLGHVATLTVTDEVRKIDETRPSDPYANRENGVVFGMVSANTGSKMRATLPAPDLSLFPFAARGVGRVDAPFTGLSTELQAFIDKLEDTAAYIDNSGGVETVTVSYIEYVGRNL